VSPITGYLSRLSHKKPLKTVVPTFRTPITHFLNIIFHTFAEPNQKGKAISNPTARWVFQFFSGIHVVCLTADQALVLNLNKHQALLLNLH
jgi:hypothetical protein